MIGFWLVTQKKPNKLIYKYTKLHQTTVDFDYFLGSAELKSFWKPLIQLFKWSINIQIYFYVLDIWQRASFHEWIKWFVSQVFLLVYGISTNIGFCLSFIDHWLEKSPNFTKTEANAEAGVPSTSTGHLKFPRRNNQHPSLSIFDITQVFVHLSEKRSYFSSYEKSSV